MNQIFIGKPILLFFFPRRLKTSCLTLLASAIFTHSLKKTVFLNIPQHQRPSIRNNIRKMYIDAHYLSLSSSLTHTHALTHTHKHSLSTSQILHQRNVIFALLFWTWNNTDLLSTILLTQNQTNNLGILVRALVMMMMMMEV